VIVGSTVVTTAAMLAVRRRAPAGGYFSDSDRSASVFAFLGVGFAILLGFVIFFAFDSYSNAKGNAEQEATAVVSQFEIAALLAPGRRDRLRGDLVCYARSVVGYEWPAMRDGKSSPHVEHWITRLEGEVPFVAIDSPRTQVAFTKWFESSESREEGRRVRLLESQATIPPLLWIMLILGASLVVGYVLFYADSRERLVPQALLMASVTALSVTSLLAVKLLASPYQNESGSLKPASMKYALGLMHEEEGAPLRVPCDATGRPGPGTVA
jgi:hypothetical protein